MICKIIKASNKNNLTIYCILLLYTLSVIIISLLTQNKPVLNCFKHKS